MPFFHNFLPERIFAAVAVSALIIIIIIIIIIIAITYNIYGIGLAR
jgi:TRAP-type C4-dicarboxylate transport system permease small subunit